MGDRTRETGHGRQETGARRQDTGDRRRETGARRQETGDRKQDTGDVDRRHEIGDGSGFYDVIFEKICAYNSVG